MALVLLKPFYTSLEASMARAYLLSHGIETFLFDVENAWDTADRVSIPVRLMIAEEDLEVAAEILVALDEDQASGDSDVED